MHSRRLSGEEGQAIIFVIIVVPLLLGIAALVIDGTHLFGKRRTLQGAADAAALAAAREIDPYGQPCDDAHVLGCDLNVRTTASAYSVANGGPGGLINCNGVASATNCFQTPYKGDTSRIQVRLMQNVTDPFGKLASAIGVKNLKASASAVGSVTAGGNPLVVYAMAQTAGNCKGVSINGNNNSFTAVWSNQYYNASSSGSANTAPTALFGAPAGSCNDNFFSNNPNFGVPQKVQVPERCSTCWPKAIPDVTAMCNSAPSGNVQPHWDIGNTNNDADWALRNPQGIYCSTQPSGITIGDKLNPTDLRGYTFIALGNGTVTSTATDVRFAPASGASNITFYAGGNSGVTIGSAASWSGDVYAPSGTVSFKSNSAGITFDGFLEADSVTVLGDGVHFTGSGPLVGDPHVGLTE